jgi:CRP/FNR family transcriptional regulator
MRSGRRAKRAARSGNCVFRTGTRGATLAPVPPLKSHCLHCPARLHCLGAGLDARGLAALGACVRTSTPLGKGEYLHRAGDTTKGCLIVRSGTVQTCIENAEGEAFVTGFHFAGDLLGVDSFGAEAHTETAIALETTTICRIPPEQVAGLWAIDGAGSSLLRLIGRQQQHATAARITLGACGADRRVARFLLDLAERMRERGRDARLLPLLMRRTDLASHLGMTLESLSRVFGRFARDGLIRAGRNDVALEAPARLQLIAEPVAA